MTAVARSCRASKKAIRRRRPVITAVTARFRMSFSTNRAALLAAERFSQRRRAAETAPFRRAPDCAITRCSTGRREQRTFDVAPADNTSILNKLKKDVVIGSTVDPTNGDKGPRALSLVPLTYGILKKGQLLVCNFADSAGNGRQRNDGRDARSDAEFEADDVRAECQGSRLRRRRGKLGRQRVFGRTVQRDRREVQPTRKGRQGLRLSDRGAAHH